MRADSVMVAVVTGRVLALYRRRSRVTAHERPTILCTTLHAAC